MYVPGSAGSMDLLCDAAGDDEVQSGSTRHYRDCAAPRNVLKHFHVVGGIRETRRRNAPRE
jgi:hypothetical protein